MELKEFNHEEQSLDGSKHKFRHEEKPSDVIKHRNISVTKGSSFLALNTRYLQHEEQSFDIIKCRNI
jgi:hypothetical protein